MSKTTKSIIKNITILAIALSITTFISCFNKKDANANSTTQTKPIAQKTVLKLNHEAPAFEVTDSNGKAHKLSDYKGKIVVLEWKNSGCPFVKKHYNSGNMQALQTYAKEQDVVWLSVISSAKGKQGYVSSKECNDTIKNEKSNATAVLLDPNGELGKRYNAKVTPHMYIIDKEGNLVYNGAIDSIPSSSQSDVEKATNYIKVGIDQLKAGKPVSTQETRPYGCSVKYKI